jgi:hypothetical protein
MEIIIPKKEEKIESKELGEKNKKGLVKQLKELNEFKEDIITSKIRKSPLRLPSKAKVRGSKLKKGYIGIIKVDENRNLSGEKQMISGSAFQTKDGIYHATDAREIFFWEGRYPVIIQPSWKTNPLQIDPREERNETYGDKYKMAKMLKDTITAKKKGGSIIIWILVGVAVLVGINYITGGGLF